MKEFKEIGKLSRTAESGAKLLFLTSGEIGETGNRGSKLSSPYK
jgi:hypothetical protein